MLSRLKFEIAPLVKEMLDQLPTEVWKSPSTTFLDPAMGGGQFLVEIERRLRAAGHSEENIASRVFGCEKNKLRVNYAKNNKKLASTNLYISDFLSYNWGTMKFDVIVGNPPYQDQDDSGSNLWLKFLSHSVELLHKKGNLCFVNPPTFIGRLGIDNNSKSKYMAFDELSIKKLFVLEDAVSQKYFPGIGSKICWYLATKDDGKESTGLTELVGQSLTEKFVTVVDLYDRFPLPTKINQISMSIHNKLKNNSGLKFTQKRELHYHTLKKKNQVSETYDPLEFIYKSYFSHNIIRYSSVKCSNYESIKVMVPQTSTIDKAFIDQNCNVSEDLFYVECNTQKEAQQLLGYLNSDLLKYIGHMYRVGRNLGHMLGSGLMPMINQTVDLNQDELNYIRSLI